MRITEGLIATVYYIDKYACILNWAWIFCNTQFSAYECERCEDSELFSVNVIRSFVLAADASKQKKLF